MEFQHRKENSTNFVDAHTSYQGYKYTRFSWNFKRFSKNTSQGAFSKAMSKKPRALVQNEIVLFKIVFYAYSSLFGFELNLVVWFLVRKLIFLAFLKYQGNVLLKKIKFSNRKHDFWNRIRQNPLVALNLNNPWFIENLMK